MADGTYEKLKIILGGWVLQGVPARYEDTAPFDVSTGLPDVYDELTGLDSDVTKEIVGRKLMQVIIAAILSLLIFLSLDIFVSCRLNNQIYGLSMDAIAGYFLAIGALGQHRTEIHHLSKRAENFITEDSKKALSDAVCTYYGLRLLLIGFTIQIIALLPIWGGISLCS